MANGSFGLSGFPTAPTTTSGAGGGGDTNPFTPISVAVSSVAGFSSGSFIYNRSGDYSTPVSSTGTGTFPITSVEPVFSNQAPSWLSTPTTANGSASVINNNGIATGYSYAATLTNGNIVLGYRNNSGPVRFQIVDENYAIVVPEVTTTLSASYNNVGVVALTGGGFVIYILNGSNQFQFAIYSNAGVLVTAAITDTAQTFNGSWIQVVARPDGSWIVYGTVSAVFQYKVWSATGVQVYAWTNIGTVNSSGGQMSISVRSDNSFVLLWPNTSTNNITYAVRSATNTVIVAPTSTGVALAANLGITSVCLSNNDVVFIYTATSSSPITLRRLTSANVLGAQVSIYPPTANIFSETDHIDAYLLPSDNYLISFANTTSSRFFRTINYFVVNSSNVIISGANPVQLLNTQTIAGAQNWNVFVQTTNFIHNVNYLCMNANNNSSPTGLPTVTIGTRISPTTYQPVLNRSATAAIGNTSALPVSGYAPPVSTVSLAGFYAASNATVTTAVSNTTTPIAGTVIDILSSDAIDACSLINGGVAILYYQRSSGILRVQIYDVNMVLQTTININAASSVNAYQFKVIQLSNGKLVVAYSTSPVQVVFNVYSTSYALLTTINAPALSYNLGSLDTSLTIAPLSGARFVAGYTVSSTARYSVFSDTGAILVADTTVDGAVASNVMVANNPNGFSLTYRNSGGNMLLYSYFETVDQSNSFTATSGFNQFSVSGNVDPKAVTGVNGTCIFPYAQSSNQGYAWNTIATRGTPASASVQAGTQILTVTNAYGSSSAIFVGAPCIGGYVMGAIDYTFKNFQYAYTAGYGGGTFLSANLSFVDSNLANPSGGVAPGGARLVGLYGSFMVLTYLNASRNPSFALININPASYSTTLVAGVTPSNPTQVLSQATGYSLIGVSTSDCPPGGTGNVTINGNATLNSSYPATVTGQSFDFQSPVVFGAKGTQLNRNVNLEGNV